MFSTRATLAATTALTVCVGSTAALAQGDAQSCTNLDKAVQELPQQLPEGADWTRDELASVAESGKAERCTELLAQVEEFNANRQNASNESTSGSSSDDMKVVEQDDTTVQLRDQAVVEGTVYLDREPPNVEVTEGETEVMVSPGRPSVNVNEQAAEIVIREQAATISVEMAQPTIRIEQPAPEIIITMPPPGVDVANAEPQVEVRQAEPKVSVSQSAPKVDLELEVAEDPGASKGVQVEDRGTGERYATGDSGGAPKPGEANVSVTGSEPIVRMQQQQGDGSGNADVQISRAQPNVRFERADPQVEFSQSGEPQVEFARSGEAKVTIRESDQAMQDGQSSDQQQVAGGESSRGAKAAEEGGDDSVQAAVADAEQAADEAEKTAENAAQETGQALENAGDEAEKTAENAAQETGQALENTGDEVEQTAENAAQETEEAAGDAEQMAEGAAQEGEQAMEQTAQADGSNDLQRPNIERDGWSSTAANQLTAEDLIGAELYDTSDERIGEVTDLLVDTDGNIEKAVFDVGGFLGLGEHTVAVSMQSVEIQRADSGDDLRVYVDATEDDLEDMAEYEGEM